MKENIKKVFLIGSSFVGKTPVSEVLKGNYIQISRWIKDKYTFNTSDRAKYVEEISKLSVQELRIDSLQAIRYTNSKLLCGINIIDGVRNIKDFIYLFNPKTDKVLYIDKLDKIKYKGLDRGVDVIIHYLSWGISVGLISPTSFIKFEYKNRITIEHLNSIKELINAESF